MDAPLGRLVGGMGQDPADLRLAADAGDLAHQRLELGGIRHPAGGAAFAHAAEEDELDVERADAGGFGEHLALDFLRHAPGRLAAGGGVEREDEPAALARDLRRSDGRAVLRKAEIAALPELDTAPAPVRATLRVVP